MQCAHFTARTRRVFRCAAIVAGCALGASGGAALASAPAQRVIVACADSGNLPFSNDRLEGFENRIAALIAHELDASLRYRWNVSWSGASVRDLRKGHCDLLLEVPATLQGVSTTRPYFASTYVFVTARGREPAIHSFDDPVLRTLRIGVHAIGRGGANTPAATALARRGITGNITGYPMWGDDSAGNPAGRLVAAVATGDIDAAVVWGPIAGYFAQPYQDRLELTAISADPAMPWQPFVFDMALGVREGNDAFRTELEGILERRAPDIRQILIGYGVPLVDRAARQPATTIQ